MAGKPIIGARIELSGEKDYREAIGNINKSMSVLRSELRATSAEFEGNSNSVDALRAKNEILLKQQTEHEKKLALLRGALEDANKQYGEGSKKAQDWQIKINNAYAELSGLNRELDNNRKFLKEAESSTDKTAKSIDAFGKQTKETKVEVKNLDGELDKTKGSISDFGKIAVGAFAGVAASLVTIVESTKEFRTDFAKLEVNSSRVGANLKDVSNELKNLDAITGETDSNIEALSNLLQSGIKGTELTDTVNALSGAVIKFPDTLKIESLADALQETLATSKATGQFGELLERLGYNIDTFNDGLATTTSEAERLQYTLGLLARTGLDKVNTDYVKNNQDLIKYANAQYELRESMSEIAIGVTPLLSEAMAVLSDNLGEITDKTLPPLLKGFEWMVDNVDTIEAGLKGIGAAIITKKAADGVEYAINAYKTLKGVTDAATVAQTALNTASKANVIGAIASVVVGLGTAWYSYAKSASDAAEETRKLNDETYELLETSKKLSDEVEGNIKNRKEETATIEAENGAVKTLAESLYTLADKEGKASAEKKQMLALVEELNDAIPDLNLAINEQTGALSLQRGEIDRLIEAQLELNMVRAAQESLQDIADDKYIQEQALNDILDARIIKEKELDALIEEQEKHSKYTKWVGDDGKVRWAQDVANDIKRVNKELDDYARKVEQAKAVITGLGEDYKKTLNYIGDHSVIEGATHSLENFYSKLQEALEKQTEAELGSVEDRVEKINDIYEQSENDLEKILKAEEKTFDKSQKKQVKSVEDAADEELRILKEAHDKKLKLIDEEYLEKMKLTNEDRYKELKNAQDQIDAINAEAQAEDRAAALAEEAEKKAEIQSRIDSAVTVEEKMDAQKELADFEAENARKRRQTERDLQIDILEAQKDTIDDSYDAKIKAIEEEQKKEEEKVNLSYENEKEAVKTRLDLKLEELGEQLELEKDHFKDLQDEQIKALDKQKELAIQSAKDTYEEDLAEFKLNNALKYDEAVANEEKIQKYLSEQAAKNDFNGFGNYKGQVTNTNIWNPSMTAVANGSLQGSGVAIDYDRMEDMIIRAVKDVNLVVVLDGKKVGKIVESTVNGMVK